MDIQELAQQYESESDEELLRVKSPFHIRHE